MARFTTTFSQEDTDGQPSLVTQLATALEDKDLGSTGFVTINELMAAMASQFQVGQKVKFNRSFA